MNVPPLPITRRITSTTNKYIRHCMKLRTTKKHRDECRRLLLVGKDIIEEVIGRISRLLCRSARDWGVCAESGRMLKARTLFVREDLHLEGDLGFAERVYTTTEEVIAKLSGVKNSENLAAVAEFDIPQPPKDWTSHRVVAMDGIQDPGNFGTLLRTCVSLGWGPVLLLPNCCDPYNDKVLRSARGATFKLALYPVDYGNFRSLLETKNLIAIGSTVHENGARLQDVAKDLAERNVSVCLVLGSEGQGLRDEVLEMCERFVTIPQSPMMESLNVSVAGGILMYALNTSLHATTPP